MSSGNYLGRAGAYAMHHKYRAGNQTSAQLEAERLNLLKARLAKGHSRHTSAEPYRSFRASTVKSRGAQGTLWAYNERYLAGMKHRALGTRWLAYKKKVSLPGIHINGLPKKFQSDIGPSGYDSRTRWGKARQHKFKSRLVVHAHRRQQVKHWKFRGKKFTPR